MIKQPYEGKKVRWLAPMWGTVVDNQDPEGRRRVRIQVHGVTDRSRWAEPIGLMLGKKAGFAMVPEVGTTVLVQFIHGDIDHPVYQPGPFGAPGGVSDEPDEAPEGSLDHVTIRWRDFHLTFNGSPGAEQLTIEDRQSGTKLVIDRQSGDMTETVKGNKSTTVQEGDETHTVALGKRTTTIQGDDVRTVTAGNVTDTVTAGSKTEAVPAGDSSETVGGSKTITAGLAVQIISLGAVSIQAAGAANIQAGGAVAITAGGAVALAGASTSMTSLNPAIPSVEASAGQKVRTFAGGIDETIVGAVIERITGTYRKEISGIAEIVAQLKLGDGTMRKIVTAEMFALWANLHSHAAPGAPPTQKVLPGGTPPDVPQELVVAQSVEVA